MDLDLVRFGDARWSVPPLFAWGARLECLACSFGCCRSCPCCFPFLVLPLLVLLLLLPWWPFPVSLQRPRANGLLGAKGVPTFREDGVVAGLFFLVFLVLVLVLPDLRPPGPNGRAFCFFLPEEEEEEEDDKEEEDDEEEEDELFGWRE